jgi:hypothetical protein
MVIFTLTLSNARQEHCRRVITVGTITEAKEKKGYNKTQKVLMRKQAPLGCTAKNNNYSQKHLS